MTTVGPRLGMPIVVDKPAEPHAEKAVPEKHEVKDGVDRGPLPKAQMRVGALPVGDFDAGGGHLELFAALSSQVGEQPEGLRIATQFEATLPMFETHQPLTSLAFGHAQVEASCELMQLVREGTVELPPDVEAKVRERFATITAAPVLTPALLSAAQQRALEALVARLGGIFAQIGQAKREQTRTQALRMRGRVLLVEAVEGDDLHQLLDEAFDDTDPEPEIIDTFELAKCAQQMGLILPDAAVVAMEQAWAEEWPHLAGLDRDVVVELVMTQCAATNETALGDLLEQLDRVGLAAKSATTERPTLLAQCDGLSAQLTFYLERRAGFAAMVRLMLE